MNLRSRSALDEDAMSSDQVLLEHWVTFCGRQLTLRVTTADAASPDTVAVHVRYGSGQAEVIVKVDEEGSSEASRSASVVAQTFDSATKATVEHREMEHCLPGGENGTGPAVVDAFDHVSANTEEMHAPNVEEEQNIALLSVSTCDEVVNSDTERDEMSSCTSSKGQQDPEPLVAVAGSQAANCSTERTKTSFSSSQELQYSKSLGGSTFEQEVKAVPKQAKKSSLSVQEQQDSASLTGGTPEKVVQAVVEGRENQSNLSDQVEANQDMANVSAQPSGSAGDTFQTRRTELRIGRFDAPAILNDKTLARLLRDMPDLRCLSIEWRLDGRKLDIDIVSQHCPNLVEIDLTRFRLDTWSLEQLCVACPALEVIKLPRKCDDSCVEVLLRNLPKLRSLDLAHTNVTGQFLEKPHESLEKLSLAGCESLKFEQFGQAQSSAENTHQTACWEKLRELDLSSTKPTPADLTMILSHFPQLEGLSLAHCDKLESASLLQVALCKLLRGLDVSHAGSLQASDLLAILIQCPQLEQLSLAGCTVMESSYLRQLDQGQDGLRLRELDVSGVKGLATVDLTAILTRSPQLERLLATELDGMDLTACLTQLSRCTELRELDVSRLETLRCVPQNEPEAKPITRFGSSPFSNPPMFAAPVTGFRFGSSQQWNGQQQTSTFGGTPTGFSFGAAPATGASFSAPRTKQTMNKQKPDFNSRQIQPTVLTSLFSGCQKLERLVLAGCYISESTCLRQLAQCPKLRELDLPRVTTPEKSGGRTLRGLCQSDAADLAQALSGCPQLERLAVVGVRAPLEQLVPPTGLPSLTYLDASQSELTNNSLRRLPSLFPRLHTLNIQECSKVSEDGLMSYLPRLEQLRSLDLRGTSGVSDAVLETLKECQLTKLMLGNSVGKSFTEKGFIDLAVDCPSLRLLGHRKPRGEIANIEAMIEQQLPPHRILVLCFGMSGVSKSAGRTRELPKLDPQFGPLYVLSRDEVNWDRD